MIPSVFTIPPHRAFADALAAGLIARAGRDPLALARGIVLLPNNRSALAVRDAFVRRAEGGLLLPRLVAVGDTDLDERVGAALDPIEGDEAIPPAMDPLVRQATLARLILAGPAAMSAAEAFRLAAALARTLDQLIAAEVAPARLSSLIDPAVEPDLSRHWQVSLAALEAILESWPAELGRIGRIDAAERRNRLLDRMARRWGETPPAGLVVAAGALTGSPALARLVRTVSRLPDGLVVLPALDCELDDAAWDALGPHEPDAETGRRRPAIETHPQYQLKLLLDRIGVARGEVGTWRQGGGRDAPAARTRAISAAMLPARFTGRWQGLRPTDRRLTGVRALECAAPADEAQAIAVALRGAIAEPGATAALVTPDRNLAARVSAHLQRWGIVADDSAGRPLSLLAPGTLLIGLAQAIAEEFAPVALLAVLKHPLANGGGERAEWLAGVRALDRALRGPRPPAGLDGIAAHLSSGDAREQRVRGPAGRWWREAQGLFLAATGATTLAAAMATLRETAQALCGDALWSGPAGRAAAELLAGLEDAGAVAVTPADVPSILRQMMDGIAIRPQQGGHPRIFIWGLIEARLQHADLMVLGGLNEGTWPAAPAPDPWLAPRIRSALGLPGLELRIGIAAHDFATALGARRVLVTRARRDARAPAIASRFWLRLEAMTGGMARAPELKRWAGALDRPAAFAPAARPAPAPPVAERPRQLAVTKLDRLKADPFAFYAGAMLGLSQLDMVDADPSPAWRGSAVHAVFEAWMKEDGCDPARLRPRAEAMLAETASHPVLRALWTPRLLEAIDWAAARMAENVSEGRVPLQAEVWGEAEVAGVRLYGKVDRIDRLADGGLAIVDYKTGKPPSVAQVAEGFAMQLGLLGLLAERGGFAGVAGKPAAFEYWSLGRGRDGTLGYVASPVGGKRDGIDPGDFTALGARNLEAAVARWLTGDAPFTAKLHPEHAPYAEYDQLMRLDEWYGREG